MHSMVTAAVHAVVRTGRGMADPTYGRSHTVDPTYGDDLHRGRVSSISHGTASGARDGVLRHPTPPRLSLQLECIPHACCDNLSPRTHAHRTHMRTHARECGQLRDLVLRINAMLSRTYLLTTFVDAEQTWMGAVQVRCSATDRLLHLVRCGFLAAAAAAGAAACAHRRVVPPCLMPHCASVVRPAQTIQHTHLPRSVGPRQAWLGSRGRCCHRLGICGSILELVGGCHNL